MHFAVLDWVIFVSVPLVAWFIGNAKRQAGTWRGYFLATGNLQTKTVVATYFGANLAFTAIFLILSEEGYDRGAWAFSVPIFWFIGTLVFLWLYPKMREYIREGLTLHQAIGSGFSSPSLQRWASLWTILAFVGTCALEFYGGIKLLEWAGLPLMANISIALLLALIVTAFTVTGGFRGVAWSDIFLDLTALTATVILFLYFLSAKSASALHFPTPHLPIHTFTDNIIFAIGMALIFIPFQFCTLDSWQRLGAWERRGKNPSSWLLTGSLLLSVCYCVPILIGIYVRNIQIAVPIGSHPLKVFMDYIHLTPGLMGLVFAGFIAAVFSTVDELLNCSSLSLLFDTLQNKRVDPQRTQKQEGALVKSGKLYTAGFGFIAALISLLALSYERQISDLALAVFSGQVVFTLPLFVIFFYRSSAPHWAQTAKFSMLLAFFVSLLTVIIGWATGDQSTTDAAPLVGFLFALITFIIGSLFIKREAEH